MKSINNTLAPCPDCNGTGQRRVTVLMDHPDPCRVGRVLQVDLCPACEGTGRRMIETWLHFSPETLAAMG